VVVGSAGHDPVAEAGQLRRQRLSVLHHVRLIIAKLVGLKKKSESASSFENLCSLLLY
jgi:hypothetical protein